MCILLKRLEVIRKEAAELSAAGFTEEAAAFNMLIDNMQAREANSFLAAVRDSARVASNLVKNY